MSTRCTIKHDREEEDGQGFHLHEDLADERDCVTLDVRGFVCETSVSFTPSGKPDMLVRGRTAKRLARSLEVLI